jgi:predicted DCC family thiol-disulfide oxidoreductase YuxK
MNVQQPPVLLQVFYDGACPLCRREVRHYMKRDRAHRIDWVDIALPTFHAEAFGLDGKRVQQVMHARTSDGRVYTQVGAFVKIWEALPAGLGTTPLRWLLKIPGMLLLANLFYRLFARNRYRLTGRCTPESCAITPPPPTPPAD